MFHLVRDIQAVSFTRAEMITVIEWHYYYNDNCELYIFPIDIHGNGDVSFLALKCQPVEQLLEIHTPTINPLSHLNL